MDIATILGFVLGVAIVASAILMGGSIMLFIDVPSLLLVFGGTFGTSLMRLPMADFLRSFAVVGRAFFNKRTNPSVLIEEAVTLADMARKNGLLALESAEVSDPFMQKGIQLCVDGYNPEFVKNLLRQDIDQMVSRNEVGQSMWKGVADLAPAMGMIGTLVGLVQMLANMSDPSSVGPAMAVALLTTLYGALIANVFALPIIDKLASVLNYEKANKELVMDFIANLQEGTNPKVLRNLLNTYIPEKKRLEE
ncbi:MotA/TolQ/ExbB proton channel family protein [Methylomonas sp. LL1]|uniref:MotA/TolQ/ExbB proton channel family protein n=1 Tax=Methylomonas sp. LL1 TaxID=2785785 RepID=UPI0018C3AFB3|nr:MotA/TolQ/ExbB proton channel family protein [Methylomonas sp. LL1]QPK64750.1 MotA/TolQ/ExbB proton channel family protein [Methylomonas sp. LL1]